MSPFPRLYTPGPSSPPFVGDCLLADDPYPVYLPFGGPPAPPGIPPLRTQLIEVLVSRGHDRELSTAAVDGLLRIVRGMLG